MPDDIDKRRKKFGRLIQRLRIDKKLSLRKLAKESKISPTYLSYIERGIQGPPSQDVVKRLAGALECDVDPLMSEAGYVDEDVWKTILDHPDTIAPADYCSYWSVEFKIWNFTVFHSNSHSNFSELSYNNSYFTLDTGV